MADPINAIRVWLEGLLLGWGLPVGLVSLNDLAIESVQPDTRLKNPFAKIAHTVAAICRRRIPKQQAA